MSVALCRRCHSVDVRAGDARCCSAPQPLAHPEVDSLSLAHIDCDAFFAAIEKRDDPSLAAKPVIVGGGTRGVVSTCCYIARAFGVRSAMPMFKALKLCPHAVVLKPDLARYSEEGRIVRTMMQALTPLVQPLSIDEAFLDLAGMQTLQGAPAASVLSQLQDQIAQERGLTVSVGLSYNKFLAKLASELDKPNGFAIIGRADALERLSPLPVRVLPGVGPAGAKALERHGWALVGDVRAAGAQAVQRALGDWGLKLHAMACAQDNRPVDPEGERKTLSAETTFNEDLADVAALEDQLWLLCEKVAARARAADLSGVTVTLKLKDSQFRLRSRRRTLGEPTMLAKRVFDVGRGLLASEANGRTPFRLIGIGLSDFAPAASADKGDMMDQLTPKRAAAEKAVAELRGRFGKDALASGRGLKARRKPPEASE
ncbi:MAG: DNA polymerase IV [Caulobacterales bacterium]